MDRSELTRADEDYLKAIYELVLRHGKAGTTKIAKALDVTPASVTGMIRKLAGTTPPLLEYRKHRGVTLTAAGERAALGTVRHHRMLERFLHDVMGFSWDEVHDEADRLEHVISERFGERMAAMLGDPTHDPHGHPIPDRDLVMPGDDSVCLAQLEPGRPGVVGRVADSDPDLLRHLADIGLVPGTAVEVVATEAEDGGLTVRVGGVGDPVALGGPAAAAVFVEPAG